MGLFTKKRPEQEKSLFQRKQELAAPSRYYGNGGTIHQTGEIDVVLDDSGRVTEVWFRCQQLPFSVSQPKGYPCYYSDNEHLPAVTGVEVLDPSWYREVFDD